MVTSFLENRVTVGESSWIKRILRPGSILTRLETEKDCGSFLSPFDDLRGQLVPFPAYDSLGLGLEDLLRKHLFRESTRIDVIGLLSKFSRLARRAEDIIEKVNTEIALRHQDQKWKREAEAAAAARRRRRSVALLLPLRLRLRLTFSFSFSKKKYRSALDGLRSELSTTLSDLKGLQESFMSFFICDFPIEKRGIFAKGMDSDLDKWFQTSESSQSNGPVVDVAKTWPREEDSKAVVTRLFLSALDEASCKNDKVPVPVVPIVGVPGVGKTTLAWLLYGNDPQVSTHFRRRLWLDVSNGFNLDQIVKAIEDIAIRLEWIKARRYVDLDKWRFTKNQLRRFALVKAFGTDEDAGVHQHRYLIVVDGLKYEDRDNWLTFRELLKGTGSHVIITTRQKNAISENTGMAYVLQGLPELCAWQYVLDDKVHGQYKALRKPLPTFIARAVRCSAGVPLALSILRRYMDKDPRYLNCKEIVILRLYPSLADDMHRDFFVNLPGHLRNCFAYCSLYPPGHEMDKLTLIQLWMAQGFIPTESDSDADDLGDKYFMDLLERSLLSETQTDEFGTIRSCKMHKLMHDLSLLIAYGIINKDWLLVQPPHDKTNHYLHVSYGNHHRWLDDRFYAWEDQRTLLFLDQEGFAYFSSSDPSPEEKLQQKLSKSRSLRVLDLHKANIKSVPAFIGEMKLLRYLDLSGNPNLIMLPDSITRLIHLQTLKLSHCEKLKKLPEGIARLENLRHLEIAGCLGLTHMPNGFGQLTALRTLSMFVVGDESDTSLSVGELSELKALNHLRGNLELRHLEKARSSGLPSLDLKNKKYLDSVALVWVTTDAGKDVDGSVGDDGKTLEGLQPQKELKGFSINGYRGGSFPKWFSSLSSLVKITVKNCHRFQSLPPLHRLPHLKYLILENMDSLEYIIPDSLEYIIPDNIATAPEGFADNSAVESSSSGAIFFPSLMHLSLRELPRLKGWLKVDDGPSNPKQALVHSFPVLSRVTLDDCSQESNLTLPPPVEDLHICRFSKEMLENLLLRCPLPHLTSLCISHVKDLDYLPETLSSSLGSIQNLEIQYCPNLSCLPTFLASLKSLSLVGCDGLTSLPRDIWHLQALETLKLKFCFELDLQKSRNLVKPPNIIDLKWWPQFDLAHNDHGGYFQVEEELDSSYFAGLKSLSYLEIKGLPKLVFLPAGICELRSLKQLCLSCCENLKYLPEGLQRIPHLYKIKINDCPLLKERCCDKTSGEWEKICHIWDRDFDWDEDRISVESLENPYEEFFVRD